jgi:hypothetical protein
MDIDYPITLPGRGDWSADRRMKDPEGWQQALYALRDEHGAAVCTCNSNQELRLYPFRRFGRVHLARYPFTGDLHAQACQFFTIEAEASGERGPVVSAINQGPDGSLSLHLRFPLVKRLDKPSQVEETDKVPSEAPRRAFMSELEMLWLLWDRAQINHWHPGMAGKRRWGGLANALATAAGTIRTIAGRTVIIPASGPPGFYERVDDQLREMVRTVNAKPGVVQATVLIGEIGTYSRGPDATVFYLRKEHGAKLQLFTTHQAGDRILEAGVGVAAALDTPKRQDRVIGVFVAQLRLRRSAEIAGDVKFGAAMVTTSDFIPYSSDHDRRLAYGLIAQQRQFIKPLCYDRTHGLQPTFVLNDTGEPLPVEVWPTDEMRDEVEITNRSITYRQRFGHDQVLTWRPTAEGDNSMPALPEKRQRRPVYGDH